MPNLSVFPTDIDTFIEHQDVGDYDLPSIYRYKQLKEKGIAVLVSTPYMDEATLCDRIALMQNGHILSIETSEKIIANYPKKLYAIQAENNYQLLSELRNDSRVESVYIFGEKLHVTLKEETNILGLEEIKPSVEDCFIQLMDND